MRLRAVVLALVAALPAAAEEAPGFRIDYARLFAEHAGEVLRPAPDLEVLELPGPVIVRRRPGGIVGTDQSAWGAAGCALTMLVQTAQVVQACPDRFSDRERSGIDAQLARAADFFARNTVPRMTPGQRDAALHHALSDMTEAAGPRFRAICADPESAFVAFARHIANEEGQRRMTQVFETPRLPVMTPCL
ncbi:hypothetical protein [Salipiger mucosus]|uniref:Uncharacterized protein n=1 Tax=Salipiger mucosus DSM 16094 TaxID=1123237 RepID=S9REJ3_9RHOB|nr:hypothetical protein [Salipiger mucosus]EPX76545.1 hypothetical protein Salmuc_00376 [Salipiger mucosus DSM 16094]